MNNAFKQLKKAILFLHVKELISLAKSLGIDPEKSKLKIINQILEFTQTGKANNATALPNVSLAKKNVKYPLSLETKILKGSYKNNLETRHFLQAKIGKHFHFTAFGIDWINARWEAGNPPT